MTAEDREMLANIKQKRGEHESNYIGYEWWLISALVSEMKEVETLIGIMVVADKRASEALIRAQVAETRAEAAEAQRDKLAERVKVLEAENSLLRGLSQHGTIDRGSFAQYTDMSAEGDIEVEPPSRAALEEKP